MKTPDEIKKGLECCGGDCFNGNEECPYNKDDLKENISCIRWMSKDALAYIQQLESQVPKWISVEEQPEPPEADVYYCYGYWIRSGRKQAETAEYLCGEWKIENNFVLTHWMPMPEPPKEDA